MDRQELENHLEYLAESERDTLRDNFLRVEYYVNEYKTKYGLTPFIIDFVSSYIDQRNMYYDDKRFCHSKVILP